MPSSNNVGCVCHWCCPTFADAEYTSIYVVDASDRSTLLPNCAPKIKKRNCYCSSESGKESKYLSYNLHPWITFLHILLTAILAVMAFYLMFHILIFENTSSKKEMEDHEWRFSSEKSILIFTTLSPISPTTEIPPLSNDECEPLYVLVYAHCCVWFLFLILDHVARHMHHKMLRSRGHLRAFSRLGRLAAIPFQIVSLWTVLLAIFIAFYAQIDKANMEPYCNDVNWLMSPKNGISVLLIIEFIFVTISSLHYAISIRKFNLDKSPPDVYGWEENNYCDRWTPQVLQNGDTLSNQEDSTGVSSNHGEQNGQCLLDLIEYYAHVNRELSINLAHASQKLRELEVENQSDQPSQSLDNIESQSQN